MLMDIPQNLNSEDDGTDDEYEWRHMSPVHDAPPPLAHTAPGYANPFVGTSSGFAYTKDMHWDQMEREAERDGLFYDMYKQQQDMMKFMQESQCQTNRFLRSVVEA